MPACLYSNIYALIKNWAKLKVEDLDLCADAKKKYSYGDGRRRKNNTYDIVWGWKPDHIVQKIKDVDTVVRGRPSDSFPSRASAGPKVYMLR